MLVFCVLKWYNKMDDIVGGLREAHMYSVHLPNVILAVCKCEKLHPHLYEASQEFWLDCIKEKMLSYAEAAFPCFVCECFQFSQCSGLWLCTLSVFPRKSSRNNFHPLTMYTLTECTDNSTRQTMVSRQVASVHVLQKSCGDSHKFASKILRKFCAEHLMT